VNPPGLSYRFAEARQVLTALIYAHAAMYDAVKANDPGAKVGLVYSVAPVKGKDPNKKLDTIAAEHVYYLYNTAFLDGVARGLVDADLSGKPDSETPLPELAGRMDWLGINYYTRVTVEGTESPIEDLSPIANFNPLTLVPWEDYPKGIYDVMMSLKARYGLPMYITETGVDAAADGEKIARWLSTEMEWTKRAIKDGADMRGFFYWSLMDNYEWNHGMGMKFGLYAVGTDAAKTRTARSAVGVYKQITSAKDVPAALVTKYPPE
jgi:beta-galactosidase